MKRTLLLALHVLASVSLTTAQCKLTLEQSPEVRGLKLGQDRDSIIKEIHKDRLGYPGPRPDEVGVEERRESSFSPSSKFADLLSLKLAFLDSKLVYFQFMYMPDIKWNSDLEFTAAIADRLKLPREGWKGHYPTALECKGFVVATYGTDSLMIADTSFPSEVEQRKKLLNQKKRETFKP